MKQQEDVEKFLLRNSTKTLFSPFLPSQNLTLYRLLPLSLNALPKDKKGRVGGVDKLLLRTASSLGINAGANESPTCPTTVNAFVLTNLPRVGLPADSRQTDKNYLTTSA